MNQFTIGGSTVNTVVGNPYNVSSGYPVSSSHNSSGTSTQVSRESHSTHFRRARAVTSESLRSQRPSSNSRYSRPFLTRGWRNNYRNGRSRTVTPRLQVTSTVVDGRNRMGTQVCSFIIKHISFSVEIKYSGGFSFLSFVYLKKLPMLVPCY